MTNVLFPVPVSCATYYKVDWSPSLSDVLEWRAGKTDSWKTPGGKSSRCCDQLVIVCFCRSLPDRIWYSSAHWWYTVKNIQPNLRQTQCSYPVLPGKQMVSQQATPGSIWAKGGVRNVKINCPNTLFAFWWRFETHLWCGWGYGTVKSGCGKQNQILEFLAQAAWCMHAMTLLGHCVQDILYETFRSSCCFPPLIQLKHEVICKESVLSGAAWALWDWQKFY